MAKFCSNCGKELKEGAQVCLECGALVDGTKKTNSADPNAKSKIAAGLLGIFLGALGIHNFYLGFTSKAVAQLLITILSCGFLSVISGIWGLIEGIFILTGKYNVDANGNPLAD